MEYDVFISHASEDKMAFVEPLSDGLQKVGLKVWYDRFELKLGDSLREKIDYGLANSRYGVVVLSKSFFKKEWPKDELDALVARQNAEGKKVILPVWHEVGPEEVRAFSPILASKLAARSQDGIPAVVSQVLGVCNDTPSIKSMSVFQEKGRYGLREQCLEIIRSDNLIEWRKLIQANNETIPDILVQWKHNKGDAAAHNGGKDWEEAVLDAAKICIPGFIPIFAAVESGNHVYWLEAMSFARRLAIMNYKMGGGATRAINMPQSMLYVIGSLGISIASRLKLLDLIEQWLALRIQSEYHRQETAWVELTEAFYLPEGLQFDANDPFAFLSKIANDAELNSFFDNQTRTQKNLFSANLLCSLFELRICVHNDNCRSELQKKGNFFFNVKPLWCLMKPEMFQELIIDIFSDSEGVRKFIFPQRSALSLHMWDYWKAWKKKCIAGWGDYRSLWFNIRFLTLPGEPPDKS